MNEREARDMGSWRVRWLTMWLVLAWLVVWPAAAGASTVTEFAGGLTPGFTANRGPSGLATGPDGNLWFTEPTNPGSVGFIDRGGVVHEFTGGRARGFTADARPSGITAGPDGNVWFTESHAPGGIAYVNASGVVHESTSFAGSPRASSPPDTITTLAATCGSSNG